MKYSEIDPPYLGASSIPIKAKDIRSLKGQGIGAIVSLTERSLIGLSDISQELLDELEIAYLHSAIRDHYPPTLQQARHILEFIEAMKRQKRKTLVHCHAGVGRTGTMLHAYFVRQGISLAEAREKIKQRRVQCLLLSDRQRSFLGKFAQSRETIAEIRQQPDRFQQN